MAVVIILSTATYNTAVAQHGGHGGGYGGGAGYPGHSSSGMGEFQRQLAMQATTEQQEMLQQCNEANHQFRAGAEQIGLGFSSKRDRGALRSQLEDTQRRLEGMQQRHKGFVATLNAEQQKVTKGEIRKLQKLESSLDANLKALGTELAMTTPNPGRVNKAVKKLQSDTREWQKQHSKIAAELGISG